jgi:hypothetical protein
MTKESLISNATNTFYCFVIPEESQGLFLGFVWDASSMTKELLIVKFHNVVDVS